MATDEEEAFRDAFDALEKTGARLLDSGIDVQQVVDGMIYSAVVYAIACWGRQDAWSYIQEVMKGAFDEATKAQLDGEQTH